MSRVIRSTLFSRFTLISVLGFTACLLFSIVFETFDETRVSLIGYLLSDNKKELSSSAVFFPNAELIISNISSKILLIIYPLIGGFSTVVLYCDKVESGYCIFENIRISKHRKAFYELLRVFTASFVCALLSYALYTIAVCLCFDGSISPVLWLECFYLFLSVILIGNLFCAVISSFVTNKYFALFTPMFALYLVSCISDRLIYFQIAREKYIYALNLSLLNPYNYLNIKGIVSQTKDTIYWFLPAISVFTLSVLAYFTLIIRFRKAR